MKKFYSLVAIAAFSSFAVAQTVLLDENFNSLTEGGNTASTGSSAPSGTDFYGAANASDALPNFPNGSKGYSAGGMIKLGTSSAVGSIKSKVIDLSTDGGKFKIEMDVKGWTRTPATFKVVLIDSDNTIYEERVVNYTAVMAGSTQGVVVEFEAGTGLPGSRIEIVTNTDAYRLFIDNFKVTTQSLGVADYAQEAKAIQNTVWNDVASFSTKGATKVEVYNVNGQLVKTIDVNGNKNVNVSDLASGVYLVKSTQNGKVTTTKVVKK